MILYIVRHAVAFERDPDKWPDDHKRPLTKKGAAKFREVAGVVGRMGLQVEVCLSSPLTRAWQTAEILHRQAAWPEPTHFPALAPDGAPAGVVKALAKLKGDPLALIGHEPGLSWLLAHLLIGANADVIGGMKKGGIACIEFEGRPAAGKGRLLWLSTPKLLLGRS